ncbi:SMI1/KNR4 family protein [Flammeovirga sp. EKP202]|uniref:SMI1/KNR4 family protein n=1 Tax=Flammeovirga sp. EKP202 TaxID=2770592 RepID=UPI00165FA7D8|nr:SMI1/KNR4 family protein [Flammeovirga sp. EKP202]MBD0405299.1 SMI1/KNR4 family protein [Flammeovirga sp. EKP202]
MIELIKSIKELHKTFLKEEIDVENETLITDSQILELEKEIGLKLPSDYVMFLKNVNGLTSYCGGYSFGSFLGINDIRLSSERESMLLELYGSENEFKWLKKSIVIGGLPDEETLLLLSKEKGKYYYYMYGAWIPGFMKFDSLSSYLEKYLKAMKENIELNG